MKNLLLKILFVIGIVSILVLFAVGIVKIVPKIVASLGGSNTQPATDIIQEQPTSEESTITIITEKDKLISGESFTATWNPSEEILKKEGIFALTYSCVNDLQFEITGNTGAKKTLVCNTPFTLGREPVELTLKPILLGENTDIRDTKIAILFYEPNISLPTYTSDKILSIRNRQEGEGSLASSILTTDLSTLNEEIPPTSEETPTTSEAPTPATSTQALADLALSTPILNGNQITFSVSNIGGIPSGTFTVDYKLPGESNFETSPLQRSLNPGERLGFTITLTESNPGGVLTIRTNADNRVVESTKENNVAAINLGFIPGLPNTPIPGIIQTDLAISNLRTSLTTGRTLNVLFDITNTSTSTSAFTIEIDAPTINTAVATSADGLCALRANKLICTGTAMNPRERRSYSFTVDNLRTGVNQPVIVRVDTQNVVAESNESNNQGSVLVSIY